MRVCECVLLLSLIRPTRQCAHSFSLLLCSHLRLLSVVAAVWGGGRKSAATVSERMEEEETHGHHLFFLN